MTKNALPIPISLHFFLCVFFWTALKNHFSLFMLLRFSRSGFYSRSEKLILYNYADASFQKSIYRWILKRQISSADGMLCFIDTKHTKDAIIHMYQHDGFYYSIFDIVRFDAIGLGDLILFIDDASKSDDGKINWTQMLLFIILPICNVTKKNLN